MGWNVLSAVVLVLGVKAMEMESKKCPMGDDMETMKNQMIDSRVAEMKKDLGLNAEQEITVKATLEAEMARKSAQTKDAQEKMMAIHETTEATLKEILTPQQQAKLDDMKKRATPVAVRPA